MVVLQQIWSFVCDHYHAFIELGLAICVLLVTLLRKKVKIDDAFTSVLMMLPDIINLAESKYQEGSEKYGYVFNRCVEILVSLTHRSNEKVISEYTAQIDKAIENVLSTPQKKER